MGWRQVLVQWRLRLKCLVPQGELSTSWIMCEEQNGKSEVSSRLRESLTNVSLQSHARQQS